MIKLENALNGASGLSICVDRWHASCHHARPMADETQEPLYEIRTSPIHGRGLYARDFIEKDTWIVQYVGEKVDKQESDRRSNELLEKSKENGGARVYVFILTDEWDIDGNVETNDARLVNHSCD